MRFTRRGFTLVEMLVVISIMIVLMALLLPAIGKAYRAGQRTGLAADLQAVAAALEAYHKDFNDYPRVTLSGDSTTDDQRPNPMTGAQVLCYALIGPAGKTEVPNPGANLRLRQDGLDGPGFATRRLPGPDGALNTADDVMQGKPFPSYLSSQFQYADPLPRTGATQQQDPDEVLRFCILDRYKHPILYFPASASKPNVRVPNTPPNPPVLPEPYCDSWITNTPTGPVSESSRYDADDNLFWFTDDPAIKANEPPNPTGTPSGNMPQAQKSLKRIRAMLGDLRNKAEDAAGKPYGTPDGIIQQNETPVELPFLLWAMGPDERFGPLASFSDGADLSSDDMRLLRECDDVTNFR